MFYVEFKFSDRKSLHVLSITMSYVEVRFTDGKGCVVSSEVCVSSQLDTYACVDGKMEVISRPTKC